MQLNEYFKQICEECISDNEVTWNSYLNPCYKFMLIDAELTPDKVENYQLTWDDVGEMLKLEVERRCAATGKGRVLAEWVYEIIDGTINPMIEAGETDLINSIVKLLQSKAEVEEKEELMKNIKLAELKEKASKMKKPSAFIPKGMDFAKKEVKN